MSIALVVDDSKTIRTILRRSLSELGYNVLEAADGQEALQAIDTGNEGIDLVLTDWNMPVMNGLELLRNLRKRPELRSIRVVMVTTEAEMSHVAKALAAGADEYVMKPFSKEILKEKLALLGLAPELS